MLKRELEPEVMDTGEEAAEYQAMNHSEVNQRFAEDLRAFIGWKSVDGQFLDVGTGTALIPIACCRMLPDLKFVAGDLSQPMLELAMAEPQPKVLKRASAILPSLIFKLIFMMSPHAAAPTSPTPSASLMSPMLRGFMK